MVHYRVRYISNNAKCFKVHSFLDYRLRQINIHRFVKGLIRSFTRLCSYSFMLSFVFAFVHLCLHSFIYPSIHLSIYSFINANIYSCIHSFVCQFFFTCSRLLLLPYTQLFSHDTISSNHVCFDIHMYVVIQNF